MKYIFLHSYRFFHQHKTILYGVFFSLLVLFALAASQLRFDSDMQSMMPEEKGPYNSKIFTQNKSLERIFVSVSLKDTTQRDPDALVAYTEALSNKLTSLDKEHVISRIETKQDDEQFLNLMQAVQQNLPFLQTPSDYQRIERQLNKDSIHAKLASMLQVLSSPNGMALKSIYQKDPLGLSFSAFNRLKDLKQDEQSTLYDGYILSSDEQFLTFFVYTTYPASDTKHNQLLEPLFNRGIQELAKTDEFKSVSCIYFGGQLVAAGNAVQMSRDTTLTLSITLLLLLVLFVSVFRNPWAPLQIMIPVVFGGLFGMAVMYLIKGHVSLMALGASSVILGIAVNYSLHFMSHLRHADNKEATIADLCEPMTIGSFTTISAFLSLLLVHTPVLQELGLFTAMNLIGSSICTLVFLPHFVKKQSGHLHISWLDKMAAFNPAKNKWILIGICAFTIAMAFFMNKVQFNEDLMKMNFMSSSLTAAQQHMNQRHAESLNSIFCVSEAKTLEDALNQQSALFTQLNQLKENKLIRKYSSPAQFMLSQQQQGEKIQTWNSFWTPERKQHTLQLLASEGMSLGFQANAFDDFASMLQKKYTGVDSNYAQSFRQLFQDFIITDSSGVKIMALLKAPQTQRLQVFNQFKGNHHNYLTDRQFISTRFVDFIKDDFFKILAFTSFIVFFTILLSYGRIEIALISFIPMVITWICILGLMALLHIEFNIINIIISTLIFGLGDDYSIFITDGLIEKYKFGSSKINSIKSSIYLSAVTTMIGLGILIFAKHPALRSIAMVSVIGIFSILLVSQSLQPLLFNFFIQGRTDKKRHPFTLWSFTKTIFAFTYYVTGCMLVTILGFILTKCIPFAKDKMKYIYHVVICKMMWSLLYMMANAKKSFANRQDAHFEKPCVIIANHSSFLDLLRIISLHPKILLMTNKWVWRSPVFGALVRMADYYPVEEGAEYSIEKLKYWVDRGYSIAVFPEGTRSYDGVVKRFHKGAFYIAEQLKLDILPALFHGIHYTMSKGDFLLKNGEINVKFLPRIAPDDKTFGQNYTERAKYIGRYFREQLALYAAERETVHYYREQLIKNYIYKGPVVEWYARIKTKLENDYETIEALVPQKGNILDLGCGYGFLDFILAWKQPQRQVLGLDYDEEKINVALNNVSKTDNVHFIAGDALQFPTDKSYDAILLMDVLHYLPKEKQDALLNRCIQHLNSDGVFIVRDGWAEYQKKHKGTLLSEFFSTKVFGFNKTENELHFISGEMLKQWATQHHLEMRTVDETQFTSNIITVFTKS